MEKHKAPYTITSKNEYEKILRPYLLEWGYTECHDLFWNLECDKLVINSLGKLGHIDLYRSINLYDRYLETDIHKFLKAAAELMGKEYKPFLGEKDTIWCPTKELANQVLKIANKLGYEWSNKGSFIDCSNWSVYKQETCYYISEGMFGSKQKAIISKYNIIPAKEFINYYKEYLNMNEKRNVQITFEQAKEWYNGENQTLKTLALSAFKKEELELTLDEIFDKVEYSVMDLPITVGNIEKVKTLSYLAMLAKYFNNELILPTQFFIKGKYDGEIQIASHTGVRYPGIIYFNHSEDLRKAIKLIGDNIKYLFE